MLKANNRFSFDFDQFRLRCEEHRHRGHLPCPWPDCPEGTQHKEIFSVMSVGHETPFIRREWHALNGSLRYAWNRTDGTAYWDVIPLVRAELERAIPEAEATSPVFHYTTVEGLVGIVESDDLWLTDYEFLNDATEVRYGLNLLASVLQDAVATDKDPRTVELIAAWANKVETPQ
jgi:hypothetical protein